MNLVINFFLTFYVLQVSTASTTEILNNRFRSKSTTLNPLSSPAAKQIIQSVMPAPSKPVITTTNRALGHFMPPSNPSSPHHPHLVVSGNNKTNSEQLIESLEMMKNLAADLPTNNSPLRRSYTVHARKLTRQAPVSASSPSGKIFLCYLSFVLKPNKKQSGRFTLSITLLQVLIRNPLRN